MLRLKGELLSAQCPVRREEVLASLREAIAVAQRQGASFPGLRAAISLARLLAATGDIENAYTVLQPACVSIREGSQLTDIRTAQALLADLKRR
ncbi:hypothetical protein D3C72_1901180 [compost metagenome]